MMQIATADFETFYSKDFSLSKMTTEAYINDPRFEALMIGVKINDEPTYVLEGSHRDIKAGLQKIDWDNTCLVAHNAMFDAAILEWVFDIRPKVLLCTLSMGRALHGTEVGNSLDKLTQHYRLGDKGKEVLNALGKRREDFTPYEWQLYKEYCVNDVGLTYKLFKVLQPRFNRVELKLIDMTLKMFTMPTLQLDIDVLNEHLASVLDKKEQLLNACGVELGDIRSDAKLAELLTKLGVEPPRKISATTGKENWAFAKTDEVFKELLAHPSLAVQTLVAARLGVKTTIEETRTERFIEMAGRRGGVLPVGLYYYGAKTGRWSAAGSEKVNCFGGDFEVLTRDGWVRFDQWDGSSIMQWHTDNTLSFCDNPGYLKKHISEDVVNINNKFISGIFTKDHRFVRWGTGVNNIVVERTAGFISEHSGLDYVPLGGVWGGNAQQSMYSPDEVRLMVAIAADGSEQVRKSGAVYTRIGLVKPRKIERMRKLLDAVGVSYSAGYCKSRPHVFNYSIINCPYRKGIGKWVLSLNREALDAFVDEFALWDGWAHTKTGSPTFSSMHKEEALWVSTALHLSGYAGTIRQYKSGIWNVYCKSGKTTSIDTKREVRVEHYDGLVYCASVDSSYILVRSANGGIFVCGQCQNLPRKSKLKEAIVAPPGHVIVGADLSNIELRVGLWYAGQMDKLQLLADGLDLYKDFASTAFGVAYEEVNDDQRFVGKTAQLSLIYQTGANKLRGQIKQMSTTDIGEAEAKRLVDIYRSEYSHVAAAWRTGEKALEAVRDNNFMVMGYNDLVPIMGEEGAKLPSGLFMRYPGLEQVVSAPGRKEWRIMLRKGMWDNIYGGKVFQGHTQALARCVMGEAMVRIAKRYPIALTIHDACYLVVEEHEADEALQFVIRNMKQAPAWMPGIPLDAEGGYGKNLNFKMKKVELRN